MDECEKCHGEPWKWRIRKEAAPGTAHFFCANCFRQAVQHLQGVVYIDERSDSGEVAADSTPARRSSAAARPWPCPGSPLGATLFAAAALLLLLLSRSPSRRFGSATSHRRRPYRRNRGRGPSTRRWFRGTMGAVERCDAEGAMCRNIKTLHNFKPPATDEEIRASSLQFVRKLSGFSRPSKANEAAFARAVDRVAKAAHELLDSLVTSAPPRNREVEVAKARIKAAVRYRPSAPS